MFLGTAQSEVYVSSNGAHAAMLAVAHVPCRCCSSMCAAVLAMWPCSLHVHVSQPRHSRRHQTVQQRWLCMTGNAPSCANPVPNIRCAGYITFKESSYPYNPANFGSDGISMVRTIRTSGHLASQAHS